MSLTSTSAAGSERASGRGSPTMKEKALLAHSPRRLKPGGSAVIIPSRPVHGTQAPFKGRLYPREHRGKNAPVSRTHQGSRCRNALESRGAADVADSWAQLGCVLYAEDGSSPRSTHSEIVSAMISDSPPLQCCSFLLMQVRRSNRTMQALPAGPSTASVMREDQVQTGVQFLKHPKVQTAPLSQRITFLERKGLTQEEIAEALERVKRGGTALESSSQLDQLYEGDAGAAGLQYRGLAPPVDYLPPQPLISPPPSLWHNPMVTVPSALAAGLALGAGATHAYRMFRGEADETHQTPMLEEVGPSQPGFGGNGGALPPHSDQQQLQQLESVGTVGDQQQQVDIMAELPQPRPPDPFLELAKAIETQAQALSALAQASERSRLDLHAVLNTQVATQTSEIRSELSTIKQMLLMSGAGGAMYSSIGGQRSHSDGIQLALPPAITPRLVDSPNVDGTPERGSPQRTDVEKAETSGDAVVGGESSDEVKIASTDPGAKTERSLENMLHEMRQALANMMDQNEGAVLTDAADMMLIYLNNLIKYPLVPRFRKVALINQGYKERVAKAKGHQAFLRSVGYHEAPTYFEWGWHSAEGQQSKDNAAVLQSAMALLTAVKNGQVATDLPPAQQEPAQPQQQQQTDDAVLSPAKHVIAVGSVVKESISLEAASTVAAGMSPARASPPAPTGAMSAPSPPSATPGPGTPKPAVPNPRVHPQHPAPSPTRATSQPREAAQPQQASEDSADGGPQYPKSFIEIMQMTERGETPAGIQEVEDRLSKDASQLVNGESRHSSSAPPPPKPWEVRNDEAAGAAVGEEGQRLGQYGSEAQEHVLQVPDVSATSRGAAAVAR